MELALTTRRGVGSIAYSSHDEVGDNSLLRAQLYGYGLDQRLRDPLGELLNVVADVPSSNRRRRWNRARKAAW